MGKLEKKYPLGCLIKWKSPWMEISKVGIVVGYSDYESIKGEVISSWLKALVPKFGIKDVDPKDCRIVSKFYSKYKWSGNENRKRS